MANFKCKQKKERTLTLNWFLLTNNELKKLIVKCKWHYQLKWKMLNQIKWTILMFLTMTRTRETIKRMISVQLQQHYRVETMVKKML